MPRLIGAAQTSVFQEALSNNYTSNSTFTAPATRDIELLVVAGGGGGGGNPSPGVHGGGGGAGGVAHGTSYPIVKGTTYPITIGAGGAANAVGANSVFTNPVSSPETVTSTAKQIQQEV